MSAAACKVILCGGPPRAQIDHITDMAQAVLDGDIPETDQVLKALQEAARTLDACDQALDMARRALRDAAFPLSAARAES